MSKTPRMPKDTSIAKVSPNDSVESTRKNTEDTTSANSGHLALEQKSRGTRIVNESSHDNIQEQEIPNRSRARHNDL